MTTHSLPPLFPVFEPALAWPEPQPFRYPHQSTYGTDTMPSTNDPQARRGHLVTEPGLYDIQPIDPNDPQGPWRITTIGANSFVYRMAQQIKALKAERDQAIGKLDAMTEERDKERALRLDRATRATEAIMERELAALRAEDARICGEKQRLRDDLAAMTTERDTATRHASHWQAIATASDRRIVEIENDRDQWQAAEREACEELAKEAKRGHDLANEVMKLQGEMVGKNRKLVSAEEQITRLKANQMPPGAYYVLHDPGVYVVTQHGSAGIHVTKYLHRDAVVLADPPSEGEWSRWFQFYRDGITGNATAWCPPDGQQRAISDAAMAYVDPSAKPWHSHMVDPGKGEPFPGPLKGAPNDLLSEPERDAALNDPLGARVARLERQLIMAMSHVTRLEAWAGQFDNHNLVSPSASQKPGTVVRYTEIKPLSEIKP